MAPALIIHPPFGPAALNYRRAATPRKSQSRRGCSTYGNEVVIRGADTVQPCCGKFLSSHTPLILNGWSGVVAGVNIACRKLSSMASGIEDNRLRARFVSSDRLKKRISWGVGQGRVTERRRRSVSNGQQTTVVPKPAGIPNCRLRLPKIGGGPHHGRKMSQNRLVSTPPSLDYRLRARKVN